MFLSHQGLMPCLCGAKSCSARGLKEFQSSSAENFNADEIRIFFIAFTVIWDKKTWGDNVAAVCPWRSISGSPCPLFWSRREVHLSSSRQSSREVPVWSTTSEPQIFQKGTDHSFWRDFLPFCSLETAISLSGCSCIWHTSNTQSIHCWLCILDLESFEKQSRTIK